MWGRFLFEKNTIESLEMVTEGCFIEGRGTGDGEASLEGSRMRGQRSIHTRSFQGDDGVEKAVGESRYP